MRCLLLVVSLALIPQPQNKGEEGRAQKEWPGKDMFANINRTS